MKQANEITLQTFLRYMSEGGFPYTHQAARLLLCNHPDLGRREIIENPPRRKPGVAGISKTYHQYFNKAKVIEYISLRKNEHKDYYSVRTLCDETNIEKVKYSIWRQKLQHIMIYKLQIHPVKKYGFVYVTRAEATRVKQQINPIRSNVK